MDLSRNTLRESHFVAQENYTRLERKISAVRSGSVLEVRQRVGCAERRPRECFAIQV